MLEKLKKTAVVVILTLLIWSGSYLALEQKITRTATLDILSLSHRSLLVTFIDAERPIEIELTLKGPAVKITQLKKMIQSDNPDEKEKFDFYFDAEEEGKSEPGRHFIDLPELLRKTTKIRNYNLTIESCEPSIVEIKVEKLVLETLTIQCLEKDSGVEIIPDNITPSPTVEMYVKESWPEETLKAKVVLTPEQIAKARHSYVTIQPFIVLAPGEQPRYAEYHNIFLPSTALPIRSLQPSIGYIYTKNIREKYNIELLNEKELTSTTSFRATEQAWKEYENTMPHLLIPISETEPGKDTTVEVIYNFPQQHHRNGDIELADPDSTPKAKFKLVPIAQPAGPIP